MSYSNSDRPFSLLDLGYQVALGGDLEPWELTLPNARRVEFAFTLAPMDRTACMNHSILTCAEALAIDVPKQNAFYDPRLYGGENQLVPTTHLTRDEYSAMYRAVVEYIKTGNLPENERTHRCPSCKLVKLRTTFHLKRKGSNARQAYCSQCMNYKRIAARQNRPTTKGKS